MQSISIFLVSMTVMFFTSAGIAQTPAVSGATDILGGSTPCDLYIKQQLKIPASLKCDFMRWNVHMNTTKPDSGTFTLNISYGEAKPNTNGFIEEYKIEASGNFQLSTGAHDNKKLKLYHLRSSKFESPLLLTAIDKNVFQFADNNKKFLNGNGGWSYSLYKMKQ